MVDEVLAMENKELTKGKKVTGQPTQLTEGRIKGIVKDSKVLEQHNTIPKRVEV